MVGEEKKPKSKQSGEGQLFGTLEKLLKRTLCRCDYTSIPIKSAWIFIQMMLLTK